MVTNDYGIRPARPASSHRYLAPMRPARRRSLGRSVTGAPRRVPTPGRAAGQAVLEVQDLKTYFFTYDGIVRALDGIDLTIRRGETTGIVGETGCGKSVTAFSIDRLISEPGRVVSGKILFKGADLLWGLDREARFRRQRGTDRVTIKRAFRRIKAGNERMAAIRGRGISMIFQEPMQAMNPVFSISDQLGEALLLHRGLEIVDGLLAANREGSFTEVDAVPGTTHADAADPGGAIAALLETAATGKREELRAAAERVAAQVGVASVGPELFYLLRNAGADAPRYRHRVHKALQRFHLSRGQRSYLLHQRRLMLLQKQLNDVYFKEMYAGKSLPRQRRTLQARMRFERAKRFYLKFFGYKRRVMRPLKKEVFWRTVLLLEGVRIANPAQIAKSYPHELSGGMLQRVMIAMALCSDPEVLLADEPTTALDVTIQMQILELMHQLRERVGTAIVLITHDLGVVAEVCDRVNVMYAGVVVETAPVGELFRRPLHPYTQGLLSAIPRMDRPDKELASIPGSVPNLINPPSGCRFHPRCPYAMPICKEKRPEVLVQGEEHGVACFLYEEAGAPHGETAAGLAPVVTAPQTAGTSA